MRSLHPVRFTAALVGAIALGCVSSRPILVGEVPDLAPGEGIAVVEVESDVPIERLALDRVTVLEYLEPGHRVALLVLGAGDYRWTGIHIPGRFGTLRFRFRREEEWTFRVEPGRINYAGCIEVRQRRSALGPVQLYGRNLNRSARAWLELVRSHPRLVERYPVVYGGSARDEFLGRLSSLHASRASAAPGAPE